MGVREVMPLIEKVLEASCLRIIQENETFSLRRCILLMKVTRAYGKVLPSFSSVDSGCGKRIHALAHCKRWEKREWKPDDIDKELISCKYLTKMTIRQRR